MTASCCFSGTRSTRPVERQQRLGLGEVLLVAVRAGRDRGHALVDERRGVGHDPDDGDAVGQPRLDERGGDAGGQRDDQLARAQTRARSRRAASPMSCGFTTSARVSALRGGLDVGDDRDAVPLLELAGALGALLADQQVGRRGGRRGPGRRAGSRPSRRRRGCAVCVHVGLAAYFLEIRDRTKNVRFCGRSASRLMR